MKYTEPIIFETTLQHVEVIGEAKKIIDKTGRLTVADMLMLTTDHPITLEKDSIPNLHGWTTLSGMEVHTKGKIAYIRMPVPILLEADKKTTPDYYKARKGFEVIDVIEAFTEGLEDVEAFDAGNVIKYICRWHEKGGVKDLKKAKWYLEHLIAHAGQYLEDEETKQIQICFESETDADRFRDNLYRYMIEHDELTFENFIDVLRLSSSEYYFCGSYTFRRDFGWNNDTFSAISVGKDVFICFPKNLNEKEND